MFYILKYTTRLSETLPGFLLFRNDTMVTLNKKPMGIYNEWAQQPNSFPWWEIVLSNRNHWLLCNDKKHPHTFLITLSSLKASKSLYASDYPSLETENNVGATLEMLMQLAEEDQWWQKKHTKRGLSWPDNDVSHLYLQPASAICWQIAPPTRGHSEHGLAGRTDHYPSPSAWWPRELPRLCTTCVYFCQHTLARFFTWCCC